MALLHKPEGSKEERLEEAERKHGKTMHTLMSYGWSNKSIAAYLGLDEWTVRRFRWRHDLSREYRPDGIPVSQSSGT